MTKMKSKKMTKSTFAIIIMAIVMVAMLAFGGTYAYFTAKANVVGSTVTTGTLKLETTGQVTFSTSGYLVPNKIQALGDMSTVKATGTTVAAYRIKFAVTDVSGAAEGVTVDDNFKSKITINILDGSDNSLIKTDTTDAGWIKDGTTGYFYYNRTIAPEEHTVGGFTMEKIANKLVITLDAEADNTYQGLTITYEIAIESVQAEYVGESATATQGYAHDAPIALDAAKELPWGKVATQNNAK